MGTSVTFDTDPRSVRTGGAITGTIEVPFHDPIPYSAIARRGARISGCTFRWHVTITFNGKTETREIWGRNYKRTDAIADTVFMLHTEYRTQPGGPQPGDRSPFGA